MSTSAFGKAFTPANIVAGFKRCGIEPFDPSLFDEDGEFLAASVTDHPPPAESVPSVPDMDATSLDPVLLSVDTTSTEQPAVADDTLADTALSSPSMAACMTPTAVGASCCSKSHLPIAQVRPSLYIASGPPLVASPRTHQISTGRACFPLP